MSENEISLRKRKIVQILIEPKVDIGGLNRHAITALCDDGSIWTSNYTSKTGLIDHWIRVDIAEVVFSDEFEGYEDDDADY